MKKIVLLAAQAGGQILKKKFGTALKIEHKGVVDLVTPRGSTIERVVQLR